MSSSSPPPSYSPPRPPPPYDIENSKNSHIEQQSTSSGIYPAAGVPVKISPAPFVPLTNVRPQNIDATSLHQVHVECGGGAGVPSVVDPVKPATTSAPFLTYCHKCCHNITTRQQYVTGTFTWLLCVIVLVFFFPLAFVPFCLDSCKDVQHYCPKCKTLLAKKKRFL